jgi:hypothetical protein
MRKLTIGMATYNDYDGVYFTIQSLRMYHSEVMDDVEFVIINNSPDEKYHKALEGLSKHVKQPIKYVQFTDYNSTAVRNLIFEHANTPYVLVIDCHVLLEAGSIKKLIEFYDSGKDQGNLLQGPLLHDDINTVSTNFNDKWGSGMQGQWEKDARYATPDSEPFEIFAQGLGMFSCRKDSWLKYNENFRGFGGEEVYIHTKYRMSGKKTICLPFARWVHRFTRVNGVPYPNKWVDRYRNYIIGRLELGLDYEDVDAEFKDYVPENQRTEIKKEVAKLFILEQNPFPKQTVVTSVAPQFIHIKGTDLYYPLSSMEVVTPRGNCGCGK